MADIRGLSALQEVLAKAKENLKGVNDDLKRLTGRDVEESRPGRRIVRNQDGVGRGRLFNIARRGVMDNDGPPAKRRPVGGAFSRLGPRPGGFGGGGGLGPGPGRGMDPDSGEEEDLPHKPTVQSSVVATAQDAKTRRQSMEQQSRDKEGMARNRRMFGLLLGTLKQFKNEASANKQKEEQRREIERKLEQNAEKERQRIRKETQHLIDQAHMEQIRINRIEQKMEIVRQHEDWEKETKKLENFLCTRAKPRIFYMPRMLNPMLENKLKDTKKVVSKMISERRQKMEKEIEELMSRVQRHSEPREDDDEEADMEQEEEPEREVGSRASKPGAKVSVHKENGGSRKRRREELEEGEEEMEAEEEKLEGEGEGNTPHAAAEDDAELSQDGDAAVAMETGNVAAQEDTGKGREDREEGELEEGEAEEEGGEEEEEEEQGGKRIVTKGEEEEEEEEVSEADRRQVTKADKGRRVVMEEKEDGEEEEEEEDVSGDD